MFPSTTTWYPFTDKNSFVGAADAATCHRTQEEPHPPTQTGPQLWAARAPERPVSLSHDPEALRTTT